MAAGCIFIFAQQTETLYWAPYLTHSKEMQFVFFSIMLITCIKNEASFSLPLVNLAKSDLEQLIIKRFFDCMRLKRDSSLHHMVCLYWERWCHFSSKRTHCPFCTINPDWIKMDVLLRIACNRSRDMRSYLYMCKVIMWLLLLYWVLKIRTNDTVTSVARSHFSYINR